MYDHYENIMETAPECSAYWATTTYDKDSKQLTIKAKEDGTIVTVGYDDFKRLMDEWALKQGEKEDRYPDDPIDVEAVALRDKNWDNFDSSIEATDAIVQYVFDNS